MKVTMERREHPFYRIDGTVGRHPAFDLFGQYQYLYTSKRGTISLIHLHAPFCMGGKRGIWEAYGERMRHPEQFKSKKEAEIYIYGRLK